MIRVLSLLLLFSCVKNTNPPSLPSQFDLRKKNILSPHKKQNWGTCWSFATMTSLEGNLNLTGNWEKAGEVSPANLSEYHMDKFSGFTRKGNNNHVKNDWYSGQGADYKGSNLDDLNSGLIVHLGGDFLMATAYLTNTGGGVQERLTPNITKNSDHLLFSQIKKQNSYSHFLPKRVIWYRYKNREIQQRKIKKAIMKHGPVATSQYLVEKPLGFFKNLEVHGYWGKEKANHALNIIGWDDEFHFKKHKGAWLVKDSDHEDEKTGKPIQYFWVPYSDKFVGGRSYMGAVSFQDVEKIDFSKIYTHSLHGKRFSTLEKDQIESMKNRFLISKGKNLISHIGIYTLVPNEEVTLEILDIEGNLIKQVYSGKKDEIGFHLIELDIPLNLKENQFYDFSQTNKSQKYAFEASFQMDVLLGDLPKWGEPVIVKSKAGPNQSFFLSKKQWIDFRSFKGGTLEDKLIKDAKENDTANFSLNVYSLTN